MCPEKVKIAPIRPQNVGQFCNIKCFSKNPRVAYTATNKFGALILAPFSALLPVFFLSTFFGLFFSSFFSPSYLISLTISSIFLLFPLFSFPKLFRLKLFLLLFHQFTFSPFISPVISFFSPLIS